MHTAENKTTKTVEKSNKNAAGKFPFFNLN